MKMTNEQITKVEAVEHSSNHKFAFSRYANLRDFEVYKYFCLVLFYILNNIFSRFKIHSFRNGLILLIKIKRGDKKCHKGII